LTRATPHAWSDEIARLRGEGQLDEARASLQARLGDMKTGGADRARAEGWLARIELARGDYEAAIAHFRNAIPLDHAEGLLSCEADDAFALSFALHQRMHKYAEARAALADSAEAIALYPEGSARLPYYEGVLLEDNPHAALLRFEEARRRAARLGMKR